MKLNNIKLNLSFVIITLVITLIVVPVLFNVFFLWDSGLARGDTSDWFTLYGNIIGGLIGGFFTYLALLLTFNEQKENKKNEMRPRIDIPHQTIEFVDSNDGNINYDPIVIEINNYGGSIAKNIECKLSLPNYEEVLQTIEQNKDHLKIDLLVARTVLLDDLVRDNDGSKQAHLFAVNEDGEHKMSFGGVSKEYNHDFIGTCLPLVFNYEAKTKYILDYNISNWINYIVQKRNYTAAKFDENELFNFNLEVKYSSDEYGDFSDTFNLEWDFIGIWAENSRLKFKYVLKSTKVSK